MHSFVRSVFPGAIALALLLGGTTAQARVVINEIDYDQPTVDTAEFIELYNTGPDGVDLTGYAVELVNGNGALVYRTIPLTGLTLAAGEFLVICANGTYVPNCGLDIGVVSDLIQNGAPDAVVLRDDGSAPIDVVSYEGDTVGYVEGTGVVSGDGPVAYTGIGRFPDGYDTDDNSVDFTLQCSTPGWPNSGTADACFDPLPVDEPTWDALKALYRD